MFDSASNIAFTVFKLMLATRDEEEVSQEQQLEEVGIRDQSFL